VTGTREENYGRGPGAGVVTGLRERGSRADGRHGHTDAVRGAPAEINLATATTGATHHDYSTPLLNGTGVISFYQKRGDRSAHCAE